MSSPSPAIEAAFGFDHVVIAVSDLARAMERFGHLGFNVQAGGHHRGFGTANALVKLDNGYIELLTVEDAAVAGQAGIRRRELVEYLNQREGGLIGYAITCDSLENVQRRGGRADPRLDVPPLDMSRTRPDGSTVRWRLLVPGGSTWCRPWPFLIEWDRPDDSPVSGPPGPNLHTNGASAIAAITVGTTSLAGVDEFYRDNLGLDAQPLILLSGEDGRRSAVDVGGCRIEFVEVSAPTSPGPLSATVDGEGVMELRIRVASIEAVGRLLADRGISATASGAHRLSVGSDEGAGARLAFVE